METNTIIIIVVVVVLLCCSSIGSFFMMSSPKSVEPEPINKSESSVVMPPSTTSAVMPPSASTSTRVIPDCPDVGFGTGKPGITVLDRACGLGESYTGKLVTKCTAQGQWIDDNQCVSSGNNDLIDISGDWNMMYSGNMGTAKITAVDSKNWNVTTTPTPGSKFWLPEGTTTIKYIDNQGYSYKGNQPAKFTDSSHTKLDGGNYSFSK